MHKLHFITKTNRYTHSNLNAYSDFVKSKLDNIDLDLPPEKLQNEVLNLQNKLKTIQSKGLPLYSNQGATQELWERFYEKLN